MVSIFVKYTDPMCFKLYIGQINKVIRNRFIVQVCDVISQWETAYAKHTGGQPVSTDFGGRTVRFSYRKHMHFSKNTKARTEKERYAILSGCKTAQFLGCFNQLKQIG